MPTKKESKRGPHPQDKKLFAEVAWPILSEAVADLSWLRSRGYDEKSSVKIVGDRYELAARQRTAVGRSACGDAALTARTERRIAIADVRGRVLCVDGFNLLTTIEAALGGGVLLRGRDGCIRDMSSMHGNYRVLSDTGVALEYVFKALDRLKPARVVWYLDKPVSNSGQLKGVIGDVAKAFGDVKTEVRLVKDPDPLLKKLEGTESVVVSADSAVFDECGDWANLADYVLAIFLPDVELISFDDEKPTIPEMAVSTESPAVAVRRITSETNW